MQTVVDWQEWISAADSKSGATWKKVVLCVWWNHCGSICFEFLNCNKTLNADILSTAAMCAWKSKRNALHLSIGEILCKATFSKNHTRKSTGFILVCSSKSTIFTRSYVKWFPSIYFYTKCQKNFREEVRWKGLWKTSWAQNQLNFTWEESTSYLKKKMAKGGSK